MVSGQKVRRKIFGAIIEHCSCANPRFAIFYISDSSHGVLLQIIVAHRIVMATENSQRSLLGENVPEVMGYFRDV
jgi:hypothetical protein